MGRVLIGVLVIGVRATVALANEPDAGGECREAARRASAAISTVIARPRAIADAGRPCPPSDHPPVRGCVVGVIRHGATCTPAAGIEISVGTVTVTSDAAGAYRACNLAAGTLVLQAPMAAITREVRAGDVADLDTTIVGDFAIPLAETSIVTFDVERVVDGAPLGSRIDVFVQLSPAPVPPPIARTAFRPSYELGRPLRLRVARDSATRVLVSETCWIEPAPQPPRPAPRSSPRGCGHCGAFDPSLLVVLALLGLRRRRRC